MKKDRKRVMCGGLAFDAEEDMEMLHQYALEGWIFREFKRMCYILHKEEPQDLIFSYDITKVKKQDREDYLAYFAEAGWKNIPCNGIGFFYAEHGTPPIYNDLGTRGESFQHIFSTYSILCIISLVVCILSIRYAPFNDGILLLLPAVTGGLFGASLMMMIGTYLRMRRKRLVARMTFKMAVVCTIISGAILCFLNIYLSNAPENIDVKWLALLKAFAVAGLCVGVIYMIFQYRPYRDRKEIKKIKEERES